MTETPLVSVIIPVRNGARFLPETLRSLRTQTYVHFEAIILDDGSTDETAAVARQFCEADPRLRLCSQPPAGLSRARNAAIAQSRGEYLAFLDADDLWLPEKLARQMELFRSAPATDFAYTNFYFWDGQTDLKPAYRRRLPDGNPLRRLISANLFGMSTVIVRRKIFERTTGFDPDFAHCEDWDLWLRLAETGMCARGVREPLVRYRCWSGNLTSQKLKMSESSVRLLEKSLASTRHTKMRPLYRRALAHARGKLELARARTLLETQVEKIPVAIWRAWRLYPRRLKWLLWFALAVWPKFLGGRMTGRIIHRKLIEKF